jgi:hypothetical protein
VPNCKAKPFTRHYDLERHFAIHRDFSDYEEHYCDYKKCPHKEPFRKDHAREHYREYHSEDIIKRGMPKRTKPMHGQKKPVKKPETVEEFLAARLNSINLRWWRCSKCLRRVRANDDGYICPTCRIACEPERVAWRGEALAPGRNPQAGDSNTTPNLDQLGYMSGCGQCENTWLPDKKGPEALGVVPEVPARCCGDDEILGI